MTNESIDKTPLVVRIEIHVDADSVVISDVVRVALVNTGPSSIIVSDRLAIGYENSTDRELWALLRDRQTGESVGSPAQLYHRAPHSRDELLTLNPGREATTEFRLEDWYAHPAGDLELVVVYDSDELASRFSDIEPIRVPSDPTRIVFARPG